MAKETLFDKMNTFFQKKIPYFFILSFDKTKGNVLPLSELDKEDIFFKTPEHNNLSDIPVKEAHTLWKPLPFAKEKYAQQYDKVMQEIQKGNTYLLNLTCESEVATDTELRHIFYKGESKYKLFYKDAFIHFSPEPFVIIENGKIASFPMKGTIDGRLEDAENIILQDEKELNEQYTIVDLIRNDLSMVAKNVQVEKFRYVEKLKTNQKELLAVSSKITGDVREEYGSYPGKIFEKLLPAGSICGAPKQKTLEIIDEVETHNRYFYTGVWGVYDGNSIDSCVIIRYLEKRNEKYFYKSGGGITSNSNFEKEYQELKDKIYAPLY